MTEPEENTVEPTPIDPHSPMSLPAEPQFLFSSVEVGAGVQMVTMAIISTNGVTAQVVIRPELALTVAKLLSDRAKQVKSGIIPVAAGALKDLDLSKLKDMRG